MIFFFFWLQFSSFAFLNGEQFFDYEKIHTFLRPRQAFPIKKQQQKNPLVPELYQTIQNSKTFPDCPVKTVMSRRATPRCVYSRDVCYRSEKKETKEKEEEEEERLKNTHLSVNTLCFLAFAVVGSKAYDSLTAGYLLAHTF